MRNLWYRSMCIFLVVAMVFGMMPMNAFAAEMDESPSEPPAAVKAVDEAVDDLTGRELVEDGNGYAVYKEADGTFTLEVLDGEILESELLTIAGKRSAAGYSLNGGKIEGPFTALGGLWGDGDNQLSLPDSGVFSLYYQEWSGWQEINTYTVRVYHEIDVLTSPEDIGGIRYKEKTYLNGSENVKVYTGGHVSVMEPDGYGASYPDTAITASGEFKIVYVPEEEEPCKVTLNVVGSEYGAANLTSNSAPVTSGSALDAGTVVTLNAAPIPAPMLRLRTILNRSRV